MRISRFGTCLVALILSGASIAASAAPKVKVKVVHSFAPWEARSPHYESTLIRGPGGWLIGSASAGGFADRGVIHAIEPRTGIFLQLRSFRDSEQPPSGIATRPDGSVIFTTYQGGQFDMGSIQKLDWLGNVTTLHDFEAGYGALPGGPLLRSGNAIYGTGSSGELGPGVVYRFGDDGTYEIVHSFPGSDQPDQAFPFGLAPGGAGRFVGATKGYGPFFDAHGTIYSLGADGTHEVLHFFNGADGESPLLPPIRLADGSLFGTAFQGGANDCGVVYRLDPARNFTVVHEFTGPDGCAPLAGLTRGANGKLYGLTAYGGNEGVGSFFEIEANGTLRVLHQFSLDDGPSITTASLIEVEPGVFFGVSSWGGRYTRGTIFKITVK